MAEAIFITRRAADRSGHTWRVAAESRSKSGRIIPHVVYTVFDGSRSEARRRADDMVDQLAREERKRGMDVFVDT